MISSNVPQNIIEKRIYFSPEERAQQRECSGPRKKHRVLKKRAKNLVHRQERRSSKNALIKEKEIDPIAPLTKWALL